ncbi:hypothetical protein PIB30_062669 [Stylosanthes scabra]|uniref:Uncharacterized protein n=1 Tax=Stylosanthes scabra TaxID=79078 RepID=A0ABU6SMZ8_9FABA|nr:hypothetical protein [Stylosanthes scabra]
MNLCHHSSIEEIRIATNNFDELFVIGIGGEGFSELRDRGKLICTDERTAALVVEMLRCGGLREAESDGGDGEGESDRLPRNPSLRVLKKKTSRRRWSSVVAGEACGDTVVCVGDGHGKSVMFEKEGWR